MLSYCYQGNCRNRHLWCMYLFPLVPRGSFTYFEVRPGNKFLRGSNIFISVLRADTTLFILISLRQPATGILCVMRHWFSPTSGSFTYFEVRPGNNFARVQKSYFRPEGGYYVGVIHLIQATSIRSEVRRNVLSQKMNEKGRFNKPRQVNCNLPCKNSPSLQPLKFESIFAR